MISVCIATYNGSPYIVEQLHSIFTQLTPEDEIILSDDHSTDDTIVLAKSVAQAYSTPLHIIYNHEQAGYVANFENALRHSKGDTIFLSDQDDYWYPNKVSTCQKALASAALVVHDASIVDKCLNPIFPSLRVYRRNLPTVWGTLLRFPHLGCCMCFKREILQKALPFPKNRRYCTHDNWIFLIGQTFGKIKILDEVLILYRRHDANTSPGIESAKTSLRFKINYRLYLLYHLLLRLIFLAKSS